MQILKRTASLAVLIAGVGLGVAQTNAATVTGGNSTSVDGWTVSAPTGVTLNLSDQAGTLVIDKTADFTAPNSGFLVTFSQNSSSAVSNIEFATESISNNTGSAWNQFQFLLLNTSKSLATFSNQGFVPPIGTGVNFTSSSLNSTKDILTFTGSQADGAISHWGGTTAGDSLMISADPAADSSQDFSLKELPGSGGSPPPPAVPLPAAAWQSMAGLLALGAYFGIGKLKKRFSN